MSKNPVGPLSPVTRFLLMAFIALGMVEEEPEDPAEIHDTRMSIAPGYNFRPGPCEFGDDEIRNDTIFFE